LIDLFKFFLIFILFFCFHELTAQNGKKVEFIFTEKNPLGIYTVKINNGKNSSFYFNNSISYLIPHSKGIAEFNFYIDGYQSINVKLLLDTLQKESSYYLQLAEKSIQLDEVIISAERNRFSKIGDTISVYVEDIKTKPHSDAAELFNKIEGFENNDNGIFKIFGSTIEVVMIDGKRIFGGNPQLTLSNIKSDMIKSLNIIESRSKFGSNKKVLDIKLKSEKKRGFYGNSGIGLGQRKSHDGDVKFNSLLKNGFTSNFLNSNSINLLRIKPIFDNEIIDDFFTKNTFFGIQNSLNIQRFEDSDEVNNGQFINSSFGSSITLENKTSSQSFNFLLRNDNLYFESTNSSIVFEDNLKTESLNKSFGNSNQFIPNLSYGINKKVNDKLTMVFRLGFIQTNLLKNVSDSISFFKVNTSIDSVINLDGKKSTDNLNIDFGMSFIHKNKKVKSLFYNSLIYEGQNSDNQINSIVNVFQSFKKVNYQVEFIQSYPITKRILIEHRPSYSYNSGNFVNKFNGVTSNITNLSFFRLDNWVYYQQGKVLINSNFSFLNFPENSENRYKRKNTLLIRNVNLRFPKSNLLSNIDFNFNNDFINPSIYDFVVIPDSSNLFQRILGNNLLNSYFSRKFSLSYTNTNFSFFNFSGNYGLTNTKNEIQTELFFENNFSIQSAKRNIDLSLLTFNGNTFLGLKKISKNFNISITHFFNYGQSARYLNGVLINGISNFQSFNLQTVLKNNKNFNFKNNMSISYSSFMKNRIVLGENNTRITTDIKNDIYTSLVIKTILGSNVPLQPILNFEIQKFILKNKANIELKGINLLNLNNTILASQNLNQQFVNQNLNMERTILLKINFFYEKWK